NLNIHYFTTRRSSDLDVKTIVKNINTKNTNVILGNENINLFGDGYIEDVLGEFRFKISPLSFYQVNPVQAEKLYQIGVDSAGITDRKSTRLNSSHVSI